MWLFTRYGFYSIACADDATAVVDEEPMMIRARSRDHLQNLKARFPVIAEAEILTLAHRDYGWRLILPKKVWASIVADLVDEQQWSNFKNEVARHQRSAGSDYCHALHEIWQIMYEFQQKQRI
jgi:hypothetical protein